MVLGVLSLVSVSSPEVEETWTNQALFLVVVSIMCDGHLTVSLSVVLCRRRSECRHISGAGKQVCDWSKLAAILSTGASLRVS